MEDFIIRAMAFDGAVRAFAATTKNTVEKARQIHDTSPVASAALGRMLTAAAMMGTMLKSEKDIITLQIRGDGPLGGIVVTSDRKAQVKGYVFEPHVEIPLKSAGKLDVSSAIGKGEMSVTKDIGLKEPYCGRLPLVSGEIAEDLTYYFAKSEQTPSTVGLGVLVDVDTSIKQSGGFLIQVMPGAEDFVIDCLENNLKDLPGVTDLLENNNTPEQILELLLKGGNLNAIERIPVAFHCACTRQRVEKALISIGIEELEQIIKEDGHASLNCHFCQKKYEFSDNDLTMLINQIKS